MAVKVMVASAITKGALARTHTRAEPAPAEKASRTKRRRSSVYDADGNEVFITLICLKCQKIRPLSQFGLRKMADGSIRNQPWCRTCRSAPSAKDEKRRKQGEAEVGDSPVSGDSLPGAAAQPAAEPLAGAEQKRSGSVAAEVAAALAAGRG
jgi:hypothetical protein